MKTILLKTGKFTWTTLKEVAKGIITVMSLVETVIEKKGGKR